MHGSQNSNQEMGEWQMARQSDYRANDQANYRGSHDNRGNERDRDRYDQDPYAARSRTRGARQASYGQDRYYGEDDNDYGSSRNLKARSGSGGESEFYRQGRSGGQDDRQSSGRDQGSYEYGRSGSGRRSYAQAVGDRSFGDDDRGYGRGNDERSQGAPRSSGKEGWSQGGFDRHDQGGADEDFQGRYGQGGQGGYGYGGYRQGSRRRDQRAYGSNRDNQNRYSETGYGPGSQSYGLSGSGERNDRQGNRGRSRRRDWQDLD
jgi:hypothetical protein